MQNADLALTTARVVSSLVALAAVAAWTHGAHISVPQHTV